MKLTENCKLIVDTLTEKKGEDIEVMDVRERTPLADYYIIVSASNPRLMSALKEAVLEAYDKNSLSINHVEGKEESGWILIDAHDVIINIFSYEERQRINLETLLSKRKKVVEEQE